MSRSLHTDPYPLRAARRTAAPRRRRADEPRVTRRRPRPPDRPEAAPDRPEAAPSRAEIRLCRPRPGFHHPATAADIARLLAFFGPSARYGLRRVELRQQTAATGIALGGYVPPGVVVLLEQPDPPWFVAGRLSDAARERLLRAGARVGVTWSTTRIDWSGPALRDYVLFDGLMHEIGHHLLDHRDRRMRAADHERRADAHAAACRHRWASR
jgi:hypothetical protein